MKIKGPGGAKGPTEADESVGEAAKPLGAGKAFADKLASAAAPAGPGNVDPVGRVAADLKAGHISPRQAVERLMDLVMANGPAAGLPEKVQRALRTELEQVIQADPMLAGRLRRIGVAGEGEE